MKPTEIILLNHSPFLPLPFSFLPPCLSQFLCASFSFLLKLNFSLKILSSPKPSSPRLLSWENYCKLIEQNCITTDPMSDLASLRLELDEILQTTSLQTKSHFFYFAFCQSDILVYYLAKKLFDNQILALLGHYFPIKCIYMILF